MKGSQSCTVRLLSDIGSLQDFCDDHIHWLISKIGRSKQVQVTARNKDEHLSPKALLPGNLLGNALVLESFAIVHLLHISFIDLKHTDHNGNTALHLAVRSGKREYVTEILRGWKADHTLDLDAREVVYGWTPLVVAYARGDYAIVELLLRAGADPTTQDRFG